MTATPEEMADALARLYDVDLVDDPGDVDLYLALADRAGGGILEIGVGTGRLAVPLAAAGWSVTGVDRDPAMLGRARARARAAGPGAAGRLELVEADAVDLRLHDEAGAPRTFGLAIIALNTLMLFGERSSQAAAVRTLAEHLAPGGIAVVDLWLPDAEDLARYDGRLILEYAREDPETRRTVVKSGAAVHDAATQTVTLTTIFDEGGPGDPPVRWVRRDRLRLVGADELGGFAEAAGLVVETMAGGYDLEPLGPGADRVILVAVRP